MQHIKLVKPLWLYSFTSLAKLRSNWYLTLVLETKLSLQSCKRTLRVCRNTEKQDLLAASAPDGEAFAFWFTTEPTIDAIAWQSLRLLQVEQLLQTACASCRVRKCIFCLSFTKSRVVGSHLKATFCIQSRPQQNTHSCNLWLYLAI